MELAELQEIAEEERARCKPVRIRCCAAAGCVSSGSLGVIQAFEKEVAAQGLKDRVQVSRVGCLRLCCAGPLVQIDPSKEYFESVTPTQVGPIVAAVADAEPQERSTGPTLRRTNPDASFFARQQPIVLENSGVVEPERIESYIA